jgi:hypothetical protein
MYAPVSLLAMPVAWMTLVLLGYSGMFWALGVEPWEKALRISGSSLLTLGFDTVIDQPRTILEFSEAMLGMILTALLISYLPTMYSAFSAREAEVAMLVVRAGSPPSAVEMIIRYSRIGGFDRLNDLWTTWERWFTTLDETHTSLPALSFYRSPQADRSWVTAAGTVLDGAALINAAVDLPHDPQADLCIRAGFLALRSICDFFGITYNPAPAATDPISITRGEFEEACDRLAAAGVPLKPDRDSAWKNFSGWRVNYDTVLLSLALLTTAPLTPWISDRSPIRQVTPFSRVVTYRPPEERF